VASPGASGLSGLAWCESFIYSLFPLVCFNIAIKTVKNILFAYCFLLFVCGNQRLFIIKAKILLADRMQSKKFLK